MKGPVWLTADEVLAFQDEQLREHGGLAGVRDRGALDSALARPPNFGAYGEPDLEALAAAYAHGIVKNHPFIDGNKRTGFLCAYVFLGLNGCEITMTEAEAVDFMLGLSSGEITQAQFADLLRRHTRGA